MYGHFSWIVSQYNAPLAFEDVKSPKNAVSMPRTLVEAVEATEPMLLSFFVMPACLSGYRVAFVKQ